MILYFTGTGNSAYVAKEIGRETGFEVVDLFEKIKQQDYTEVTSHTPWVLVVPTYAWRIPRIVQTWIEKTPWKGNKNIYTVMTCGDGIGNAGKYIEKLCNKKKLNYNGTYPVVMPENYIAMFPTPNKEEAQSVIEAAMPIIKELSSNIKDGKYFPMQSISMKHRICSGIANDVFYPLFVHAKKFQVKDSCVSCGKCEQRCPLSNIKLKRGLPVWGNNCTHCMACISYCPREAIEYGKHSKGLIRYTFSKE